MDCYTTKHVEFIRGQCFVTRSRKKVDTGNFTNGVEAFGFEGPDIEAELVLLITKYFEEIGLNQYLTLEINTLGSHEDRGRYREALVSYLTPFYGELDEDSQRRLKTNPLRILDSKIEKVRDIVVDAPKLIEFVGKHARSTLIDFKSFYAR